MHGLKSQDLVLNIDLLGGEDIKIMAIILHNCVFHNITICGNMASVCKRKCKLYN